MGVAAIAAICYNYTEVKGRTLHNRSYKLQSLVNILP